MASLTKSLKNDAAPRLCCLPLASAAGRWLAGEIETGLIAARIQPFMVCCVKRAWGIFTLTNGIPRLFFSWLILSFFFVLLCLALLIKELRVFITFVCCLWNPMVFGRTECKYIYLHRSSLLERVRQWWNKRPPTPAFEPWEVVNTVSFIWHSAIAYDNSPLRQDSVVCGYAKVDLASFNS